MGMDMDDDGPNDCAEPSEETIECGCVVGYGTWKVKCAHHAEWKRFYDAEDFAAAEAHANRTPPKA